MGVGLVHAIARAQERYGLTLGRGDLLALEGRLAGGAGVLVRRQADGMEVRLLDVGATVTAIVFCPTVGRIFTFLAPKHMTSVERKRHRRRPR